MTVKTWMFMFYHSKQTIFYHPHLTLRKIAIWLSKNCQKLDIFFKKIAKNVHFFSKKLPLAIFFFKWKFLAIFLTVKWQFTGGSGLINISPVSPVVFDTQVHDVSVSCRVHGGHQHLTNVGGFGFGSSQKYVPVVPLSLGLLLEI